MSITILAIIALTVCFITVVIGLIAIANSESSRVLCIVKHRWRSITTVHVKLQDDQGIVPRTRILMQCTQCGELTERLLKVKAHIPANHLDRFLDYRKDPISTRVPPGKPTLTIIKKD